MNLAVHSVRFLATIIARKKIKFLFGMKLNLSSQSTQKRIFIKEQRFCVTARNNCNNLPAQRVPHHNRQMNKCLDCISALAIAFASSKSLIEFVVLVRMFAVSELSMDDMSMMALTLADCYKYLSNLFRKKIK